jgi:hypothetical protein
MFMEFQPRFWDGLNWHSKKMTVPPFSPALKAIVDEKDVHPATHSFAEFLCPSYDGGHHISAKDSEYKPINGKLPAVANYHAFAGSHFINAKGMGQFPPVVENNRMPFTGDGAIPFSGDEGKAPYNRGVRKGHMVDGYSQTLLFAESIEPAYSAWIDGQTMWLVAAWPGNAKVPSMMPDKARPGHSTVRWDDADKNAVRASINLRRPDGSATTYLVADRWSASKDRKWGPSSSHPGVVGHAFADGRVVMLAVDIDPEVYLHLATRSGREVIPQATMNKLIRENSPVETQ